MRFLLPFLSLLFLLSAACSSVPGTLRERALMQDRKFVNVDYSNVFRAFVTVAQNDGCLITRMIPKRGVITCTVEAMTNKSSFWEPFDGSIDFEDDQGDRIHLMVNLLKVDAATVVSRLSILRAKEYVINWQDGEELFDDEIYGTFYEKVAQRLKRKAPRGRIERTRGNRMDSFREPSSLRRRRGPVN